MKNFKQLFFTLALALVATATFAQVKVGDNPTTIDASSLLELESTNKGFLLPRMTQAQRDAIASPAQGLVIYNTTASCIQINTGTPATPDWKCISVGLNATTNGTGIVSAYGGAGCTGSGTINGTLTQGVAVSGVTMTLYANVITLGTYNLSSTQNGVTFTGTGTFTALGCQPITLTASGTPTAVGSFTWCANTTPQGCSQATVQVAPPDADGDGVTDANDLCSGTFAGLSVDASGCPVCAVPISGGQMLKFLCHNLGADITLDPHTPAMGLHGGQIQWGRRGPNTTGDSRIDWQTAANTANFAAAPKPSAPNEGAIAGWSTVQAPDNAWRTAAGAKTANDPCPTGYRVPTIWEWRAILTHNFPTRTGTFNSGDYNSALHLGTYGGAKLLTLPTTGARLSNTGNRGVGHGHTGHYWASNNQTTSGLQTGLRVNVKRFEVEDSSLDSDFGGSIRCIAE